MALSLDVEEPIEFRELITKLKGGLGEGIIKMFALDTFVPGLRKHVEELLACPRDLEPEDRSIIEYSLVTIVIGLLYDQRLGA